MHPASRTSPSTPSSTTTCNTCSTSTTETSCARRVNLASAAPPYTAFSAMRRFSRAELRFPSALRHPPSPDSTRPALSPGSQNRGFLLYTRGNRIWYSSRVEVPPFEKMLLPCPGRSCGCFVERTDACVVAGLLARPDRRSPQSPEQLIPRVLGSKPGALAGVCLNDWRQSLQRQNQRRLRASLQQLARHGAKLFDAAGGNRSHRIERPGEDQ